jgi:hypothetical protein
VPWKPPFSSVGEFRDSWCAPWPRKLAAFSALPAGREAAGAGIGAAIGEFLSTTGKIDKHHAASAPLSICGTKERSKKRNLWIVVSDISPQYVTAFGFNRLAAFGD